MEETIHVEPGQEVEIIADEPATETVAEPAETAEAPTETTPTPEETETAPVETSTTA